MNPTKGKIIVFGIMFWYPLAGVTYQFLNYLIGLRRLGYDPYYIEDSGRWIYDVKLNDLSPDATPNLAAIVPVLEAHGFAGRWAFRGNYPGGRCHGLSEAEILTLYCEADAFLNVTGAQELRDEHLACPRRIYVETDPVVSQIKVAEGDAGTIAALAAHDTHFSYGGNFGAPDCRVPLVRFNWIPTRPPVVLDFWTNTIPSAGTGAYNTITTWKNKGRDIVYNGESYYWSKDREFLKVLDLPRVRPEPFELAVRIDAPTETLLREHGWRLTDSIPLSSDMQRYHDFICGARGEFTVAKDQNIRLRSGWFSDRSVCYLAASRPVITQDTGFGSYLPTGAGLFPFLTLDEAAAAVEKIESDYPAACRAAGEIAREYLSAEKVLGEMMTRAGL